MPTLPLWNPPGACSELRGSLADYILYRLYSEVSIFPNMFVSLLTLLVRLSTALRISLNVFSFLHA